MTYHRAPTLSSHRSKSRGRSRSRRNSTMSYGFGRRMSISRGRSVTSTKKEEKMHGDDVHSGITSTSYTVVSNPKVPKSVDRGSAFQYIETGCGKLNQITGAYQAVATIGVIGSTLQCLYNAGTSVNHSQNPDVASVGYCYLNPNAYISGSAFYLAQNYSVQVEKLFLKRVGYDLRIANFTNAAAEVDIFIFKSKLDQSQFPDNTWDKSAIMHGIGAPVRVAPAQGSLTGEIVGYPNPANIGSNPFVYKEFNKAWKLLKAHHVNLAAAAEEKIHFTIHTNYMVDIAKLVNLNPNFSSTSQATWNQNNVTIKYPKGSLHIMMVARGALARSVDEGSRVPVFSKCEIGYTFVKHHHFNTVRKTNNQIDPLVIDPQIPDSSGAQIINIIDDVEAVFPLN